MRRHPGGLTVEDDAFADVAEDGGRCVAVDPGGVVKPEAEALHSRERRAVAGNAEGRVDRLAFGDRLGVAAHFPERRVVEVLDRGQLLGLEGAQVRIEGGAVVDGYAGVVIVPPVEGGEDDRCEEREQPPVREALVEFLDAVVAMRHQDRLVVVGVGGGHECKGWFIRRLRGGWPTGRSRPSAWSAGDPRG